MKRFFILFTVISLAINLMATDKFDVRHNYQGKNAYAYKGEILDVVPIKDVPKGWSKWDAIAHPEVEVGYRYFMDYDLFDVETDCKNRLGYCYHYDDNYLFNYSGTEPKWLRGKSFYVKDVEQLPTDEWEYAFTLVNVNNPSDIVYYIYYSGYNEKPANDVYDPDYLYNSINNFPFVCRKYKAAQSK